MYAEILKTIEIECAADNWDEEGSIALIPESLKLAREWLTEYGDKLPEAHIDCDPSGRVTAEWVGDNRLTVIAFITNSFHILAYSPSDRHFDCKTHNPVVAFEVLKLTMRPIL
jgi:hypothetical protein